MDTALIPFTEGGLSWPFLNLELTNSEIETIREVEKCHTVSLVGEWVGGWGGGCHNKI